MTNFDFNKVAKQLLLRSSGYMLTHALLPFLFFSHDFIQKHFDLFNFFCSCFMRNRSYLSKCHAIKLWLSEDTFSL